jgi:hypothetical protein
MHLQMSLNSHQYITFCLAMKSYMNNKLPRLLKEIEDHRAFRKKLKLFLLLH